MVEGPAPLIIPCLHNALENTKLFMRPVLKLKETAACEHWCTQKLVSLSGQSLLL